jgi:hypothetical protein
MSRNTIFVPKKKLHIQTVHLTLLGERSGSGYEPVESSYEYGNKTLGFIKCWELATGGFSMMAQFHGVSYLIMITITSIRSRWEWHLG